MANIILDNVTINPPVADATARNAIPTGALQTGDLVFTISENLIYAWDGSTWAVASVTLQEIWDAVSAAPTSGPYLGTDLLPLVRNVDGTPTLFKLSQANLVNAVATVIAASTDGVAPTGTDLFPIIRTGVFERLSWNEILESITGAFDPFTAKVETVADWNAAIAAGSNYIFIAANFTFNQSVQLLTDTKIYRGAGIQVSMLAYQIDTNDHLLSEESATMFDSGWNYTPTVPGNSPIFNSNGPNPGTPLQLLNTRWQNSGSAANTSICIDSPIIAQNVFIFTSNTNNSGINFNLINSSFINLNVYAGAPGGTNGFTAQDNTVSGTGLILWNGNMVSGTFATIGQNNKITNISARGGNAVNILSNGMISALNSDDSTPINFAFNGGNQPVLTESNLNSGTCTVLSGTQQAFITGSYATGVYLDSGTGTVANDNGGTLPNNTTGSFDPFTAKVTSEAELIAAIAVSGNNYINIAGNITLTANIALTQTVYLFVAPNVIFNLDAYLINRANHDLEIQISQNAQVVYAHISAGSPFVDLSGTSLLTISGQGTIVNNSEVGNTPLIDTNTLLHYTGPSFNDANYQNTGIVLSVSGSFASNLVLTTAGVNSQDSIVTAQGTSFSNLMVVNSGLSGNTLINNSIDASIFGLTLRTNGTAAPIYASNSGRIENVISADGSTLAVVSSLSGITINDANLFQAQINPNISNLNSYQTVNDAYSAGLTSALISANAIEAVNTVMGSGDQLTVTLGQNLNWDLNLSSIDGSAGNVSFLMRFTDPTSVFSYALTAAGTPFIGFDVNSDLIIDGNGGLIQNNSTVDNACITSAGSLHINNVNYILPNQFNGGIVGNLIDTSINGLFLQGGGINCDAGFDAQGYWTNVTLTDGSAGWKLDCNFNLMSGIGSIEGYTIQATTPGTVNLNGRISNLSVSPLSTVIVSPTSGSELDGAKALSGGFLSIAYNSAVKDVLIIGAVITASNSYSTDSTNSNITYVGCIISADEYVYGNVKYIGCVFDDCAVTIDVTANQCVFLGCQTRNGAIFTNNSATTILEANDSVIGNSVVNMAGLPFIIQTVTNSTITLIAYCGCPMTFLGLGEKAAALTAAGTRSIAINGTPITGLNAVPVTTTGSYTAATALNKAIRGDVVSVTYSGTAAVVNDSLLLDYTQGF